MVLCLVPGRRTRAREREREHVASHAWLALALAAITTTRSTHVHPATIQPERQARLQHLRDVGALRRGCGRLLQARAERALGEACRSRERAG